MPYGSICYTHHQLKYLSQNHSNKQKRPEPHKRSYLLENGGLEKKRSGKWASVVAKEQKTPLQVLVREKETPLPVFSQGEKTHLHNQCLAREKETPLPVFSQGEKHTFTPSV